MFSLNKLLDALFSPTNSSPSFNVLATDYKIRLDQHLILGKPLSDTEKVTALAQLERASNNALRGANSDQDRIIILLNLSRLQYESGFHEEAYQAAQKADEIRQFQHLGSNISPKLSASIDAARVLALLDNPNNTAINMKDIYLLVAYVRLHCHKLKKSEINICLARYFLRTPSQPNKAFSILAEVPQDVTSFPSLVGMRYWLAMQKFYELEKNPQAASEAQKSAETIKAAIAADFQETMNPTPHRQKNNASSTTRLQQFSAPSSSSSGSDHIKDSGAGVGFGRY